mgnify:CR=1 FL=1
MWKKSVIGGSSYLPLCTVGGVDKSLTLAEKHGGSRASMALFNA